MDITGHTVETKSIIPFGSEPVINRKFEYLPNIVKIITDIEIKRPIAAKIFEVDSLKLKGNWKKCAVINLSADKPAPEKLNWIDLTALHHYPTELPSLPSPDSQTHHILYDAPSHFHIFLLEANNGARIEIGAGFDLWRWNHASIRDNRKTQKTGNEKSIETPLANTPSLNKKNILPSGRFTIKNIEDGILIQRQIMTSDNEEFEINAKNWRFNWYFAWENRNSAFEKEENKQTKIALPNIPIFQHSTHPPCFHTKQARNQLRKSLRSVINKLGDNILCLNNISPHTCTNTSHISRPGKKNLEHWDMSDIIGFWFWANRQLLQTKSGFIITPPKESVFEELPSFRSLRKTINCSDSV